MHFQVAAQHGIANALALVGDWEVGRTSMTVGKRLALLDTGSAIPCSLLERISLNSQS